MKPIKVLLSLLMIMSVFFASAASALAIGFDAEEIYESVFVVTSGNSLGSGFAVGSNCIVTNAHVVKDSGDVTIRTYSDKQYRAQIFAINEDADIAVLIVEATRFPYLKVAAEGSINTGDDIYAIGAPKSLDYTLTKGVISAKERAIGTHSYVQIDAAVNEGNSGGPLLNDAGEVIGMNTLKLTNSEGIGLAIPMKTVCAYLAALGVELDANGNVISTPDAPNSDAEFFEDGPKTGVREAEGKRHDNGGTTLTAIAFAIAGVSIAANIALVVLLVYQKKKNIVAEYDPKERTDFDIDILE